GFYQVARAVWTDAAAAIVVARDAAQHGPSAGAPSAAGGSCGTAGWWRAVLGVAARCDEPKTRSTQHRPSGARSHAQITARFATQAKLRRGYAANGQRRQ